MISEGTHVGRPSSKTGYSSQRRGLDAPTPTFSRARGGESISISILTPHLGRGAFIEGAA